METLGEYQYPTNGSFKEAMLVLEEAVNNYGGEILIKTAAPILGYKVYETSSLSGSLYWKIRDLSIFELFGKIKGTLRATPLGKQVLDHSDTISREAKAKAIRNVRIIARAFDEWKGEVPDSNHLPAKLAAITGLNYQECQKHVSRLSSLFQETFPYLRAAEAPKVIAWDDRRDVGDLLMDSHRREAKLEQSRTTNGTFLGEVRTRVGTIVITNKRTIELAKNLLDILADEIDEQEKQAVLVKTKRIESKNDAK